MKSRNNKGFHHGILRTLILMSLILFYSHGFAKGVKINTPELNRVLGCYAQAAESQPNIIHDKENDSIRQIVQDNPRLKLEGVLMWDYDHFNGGHIENEKKGYHKTSDSELRCARIDLKSKFNKNWEAKLQVGFNNTDSITEVEDAYIKFSGWDYAALTIGQDKEPFGLEELTSSKAITTIERSMVTKAFAPGRHFGLGLSGGTKKFTWAIGVYEALDRENKRDTYALTCRVTFAAWQHKTSVLHLGLAGSVRDFGGEKYEIKEHAEVHTAKKIISSGKILARKVNLLGLETAWVAGPFSLQAEYITAFIEEYNIDDTTYMGYYLQASYFLTRESRPYKKGAFGSIKPNTKNGALELVFRYSDLDAEDNNRGVKAANFTLGVNYYINKQVRLMSSYIITNLRGDMLDDNSAKAGSFRIQYCF